MVRIRMQRLGRRNRPFYRINAVDKRTRREGAPIEQLGWYDPLAESSKQLSLNLDRLKFWLAKGAQPSDTVRDMLVKAELMDKKAWEAQRAEDRDMVAKKVAAAAAAGEKKEEKK